MLILQLNFPHFIQLKSSFFQGMMLISLLLALSTQLSKTTKVAKRDRQMAGHVLHSFLPSTDQDAKNTILNMM